jgi:hypothetical protein
MVLTNLDLFEIVDEIGLKNFIGVFMKDELLKLPKKYVGNYIINLQSSTDGNGTHYCALKIYNDGRTLWFDPFGFESPKEVDKYVGGKIPYSDKTIQNINTSICGFYCIAFLYYMTKKEGNKNYLDTYQDFTEMFDNNVLKNRNILQEYLKPL